MDKSAKKERKKEKKKTILSKISVIVVVLQYALGIFALVAHEIGLESKGDAFQFWHNTIWDSLAPWLSILPIILAIPFLIFNIIGMIVEKRIFPFLACIILPFFSWISVVAVATAYF